MRATSPRRNEEQRRLMTTGDAGAFGEDQAHTQLKVELHQRLLDLINLSALETMSRAQIEDEVGDDHRRGARQAAPRAEQCRAQAARRRRARRVARASGRSSRCSRIRRSPTSWSTATTASSSSATACSSRPRCASRTIATSSGSSRRSCRRSAGGSTNRRRWSMPGSPTAAASTRSCRRWRSTGRCCRSASSPRFRSTWRG